MKRTLLLCTLFAVTSITPSLQAQAARGFRPGQTISWHDRISGKWQSGTYVGATPGDTQPIIQQRPGDPGSQTAYDWDNISQTPPPAPAAAPAASGKGMKPGQKIRWKDRITGQWQDGEFVGETPGGTQPIILQRPGDVGSQTAFDWDNVQNGNAPAPGAANGPAIPPLPMANQNPAQPPAAHVPPLPVQPQADNAPAVGPAGAPLTETDIENWLAKRLPGNPFADSPNLQLANKELGELVKQRGMAFMYGDPKTDFAAVLSKYGINSTARGPMSHNYGPPNTKAQLFGKWITNTIGLPTHAVEGDYYVTYGEMFAARTGTVEIKADGTYTWDTFGPQGVIQGRWVDAKPDEMGDQGGAGVILKGAKSGEDWVAYKYRAGTKEEWLGLAEVNRRSVRESAARF